MRCIYTEKGCSWEVVGPMGGEWLKEVDTSSVRWRGGKVYIRQQITNRTRRKFKIKDYVQFLSLEIIARERNSRIVSPKSGPG